MRAELNLRGFSAHLGAVLDAEAPRLREDMRQRLTKIAEEEANKLADAARFDAFAQANVLGFREDLRRRLVSASKEEVSKLVAALGFAVVHHRGAKTHF